MLGRTNSGGGTGNAAELTIYGGTTRPAKATQNTIWIDTDVEITSYVLSSKEPETPAEGMAWIKIGNSKGSIQANAPVGDNWITVYPITAKQYISGEWVNKTAKSYQNAQWVDWLVRIVPNNSFTWSVFTPSRGNVVINEDGTVAVTGTSTNYHGIGYTNEAFDLTGFNKMKITYTATNGYTASKIGVAKVKSDDSYTAFAASIALKKTTTPVSEVLDISSINEPVYFGAAEFKGTVTVIDITLEV
jgi:hypothetical protein